jgi:Fungalysin/Thermolysin Propeptide Motif
MRRQFFIALLTFAMAASQIVAISPSSDASVQTRQKQSSKSIPGQRMTGNQRQALGMLGPDVSVELDDQEVPVLLSGVLSPRLRPDDPVAEAELALETLGATFRRRPDDGFTYSSTSNDRAGNTYVEMAQTYKGLPVIGQKFTVSLSRDEVIGISGSFVPDLKVKTRPTFTKDEVAVIAQSRLQKEGRQDARVLEAGDPVIFVDESKVGHLAISAIVSYSEAETNKSEEFFVDAHGGNILDRQPSERREAFSLMGASGPVVQNYLINPGFENQPTNGWTVQSVSTSGTSMPPSCSVPASGWFSSTFDIITTGQPVHGGSYKAWLGGWGSSRQDSVMSQCITLPAYNPLSGISRATLSLWVTIATSEISARPGFPGTGSPDYMFVEVFNCSTGSWDLLGYYNSFYTSGPFIQQSANLSSYLGKTISIRFRSCEDAGAQTSFYIDDLAVTVGP